MKRNIQSIRCRLSALVAFTIVLGALLFFDGELALAQFRTYNGVGNNPANIQWGAAGTQLLRIAPAEYPDDGSGTTFLSSPTLPNARTVSNALSAQSGSILDPRGLLSGTWQWGQFIDHDLDLTRSGAEFGDSTIFTPQPDPSGMAVIPMNRSEYDLSTGTPGNPRQQVNSITSYLDASNVYGSSLARANALRSMSGGRLKTSAGNLLPKNTDDVALGALDNDDGGTGATMFLAGDIRANEQTGLASIQTLFMREHNRLADALSTQNPSWSDEQTYQTARKIVGAQIQAITYNEFLPALLGSAAPSATDYNYDVTVNASVSNEFASAMFRLGHSMIDSNLMLAGEGGTPTGQLELRDVFFQPDLIMNDPSLVEQTMMGMAMQPAQKIDLKITDDLRDFLFAPSGSVGLDLVALNVQRGRENGLADYNTLRVAYGLSPRTSFSEITSDVVVQTALESLYSSVDEIDAWVGALAEEHLAGASVGELISAALTDQFTRVRDGDSFFYIGDADLQAPEILALLGTEKMVPFEELTMMDIVNWNTSFDSMPGSFFMAVPEPASWVLLGLGSLLALSAPRRLGYGRSRPDC
ncbi:MAG: peroxiredoxin [Planctomycetes bacterium]|nr:peroxiredoxin [Planctomycetota bacterium]